MNTSEICSPPQTIHKRKQSRRVINDLDNVDRVPSNVQFSQQEPLLYVFEDNETVIMMIIKGRSPDNDMFPEPTELLLIGCSIESTRTPKSKSNTLTPKTQLADMLTNGNFTRHEWNHLLYLFNISHFSPTNCSEVMSKRTQKDQVKKESQQTRSR